MDVKLQIEEINGQQPVEVRAFAQGLISIGRDVSNVLRLDDPAHTISRRHATIRTGPVPEVMDHGSRNGSFLNEQRLDAQRGYPLRNGDVIRLGPFRLTFRQSAFAPPAASPPTDVFETQRVAVTDSDRYRTLGKDEPREALERAVAELKLLNELALEIGASLDPNAVMDRVVHRSLEAIGAEQGLITLTIESEEDSDEVLHQTVIRTGQEFNLNQQLEAWMVQQGRPFMLNNPREHPVFRNVRWKDTLRNVLSVPLHVRRRLIGLLTVYNKHGGADFTPDDLQLASIIAAQSAHIIENARLFEEQKELLLMQQEMKVARDIQAHLLPKEAPAIPGYDIAAHSLAAQSVGGDHFDYIPMPEGRWALCLGDVSGKGLPAALVMANLQATLRAQTLWTDSVQACLEGANQLMYHSTNRRTFVTLFYSVLDPATHLLRYANAGHNRPLIIGADGVRALATAGFALGALRKVAYPEEDVTLAPGETLLVFSDGVVEARGPGGALFEDERLEALVAAHYGTPAQTLVDVIMDAVQAHAADEPQADDITVLALRRLPA